MSDQEVTIPFAKGKVPVVVDFENHPAIIAIAQWGPKLKLKIEEACFTHYLKKVASIGPEALPRIRRSNEIWKHLEIRSVRIDTNVNDTVVVYVAPAWELEEQMEWCIRGNDQLIYVGQFRGQSVNAYQDAFSRKGTRTKRSSP